MSEYDQSAVEFRKKRNCEFLTVQKEVTKVSCLKSDMVILLSLEDFSSL